MNTCEYCGTRTGVEVRHCRCGQAHKACAGCWRWNAKVVGEFPNQDYKLGQCPVKKEVGSGS